MGGYNSAIYLGMMVSAAGLGPIIALIGYKDGFLLTTLITGLITGIAFLLMRNFLPPIPGQPAPDSKPGEQG
jgi:hypothetical protein